MERKPENENNIRKDIPNFGRRKLCGRSSRKTQSKRPGKEGRKEKMFVWTIMEVV